MTTAGGVPRLPERAAYSTREAAELLGCSRGHLYHMANRGLIRLVRLGRRTLVPASEIRRISEQGADDPAI